MVQAPPTETGKGVTTMAKRNRSTRSLLESVTKDTDTILANLPEAVVPTPEEASVLVALPEVVEAMGDLVEAQGDPEATTEALEALEEVVTEETKALRVQAIRTELEALRARVRELEGELASHQVHVLVTSTVSKPVRLLRDMFLASITEEGNPGRRRDVVAMAVKAGMAPNTAKTQYQVLSRKWTNGDPALREELEELRANLEEA